MEKTKAEDFPNITRQQQTIQTSEINPEDAIEGANPYCEVCKGAGFVHPRQGERIIYSEVIPCSAPGCLLSTEKARQPTEVQRQTFENFLPVPGTEKALKAAKSLASGEAKFIWLLIYGNTGNGKTHLGNAIVKEVRERGLDVRMILAADLFSQLREAMEQHHTDTLLRKFKDIFFLAIDDYGVEYGSEWEEAKFDELMTSRYATGKPTVLITNKDLADLPPRVRSRFEDKVMSRAIQNSAGDYRKTRK